jgi:hypothetical protein
MLESRLIRLALIFCAFAALTLAGELWLANRAMSIAREVSLKGKEPPALLAALGARVDPGGILTALSAVVIAVAARYGGREITRNLAGKTTPEEVGKEDR